MLLSIHLHRGTSQLPLVAQSRNSLLLRNAMLLSLAFGKSCCIHWNWNFTASVNNCLSDSGWSRLYHRITTNRLITVYFCAVSKVDWDFYPRTWSAVHLLFLYCPLNKYIDLFSVLNDCTHTLSHFKTKYNGLSICNCITLCSKSRRITK